MKNSKTRLYVNKEISSNILVYIKEKQHHFLKNVIRVKIHDNIRIFDGKTGEWLTKVLSINRDNIVLQVTDHLRKKIESKDVWLIFALIKQYRMNITIQKATELGVAKIIPCITEYTNTRTVNSNNIKLNAIEAAEQSERLDIPTIEKTIELKKLLDSWPQDRNLIYCDEKLSNEKNFIESIVDRNNLKNKWSVLIGPEGGFSDEEKELISGKKNVIPVSLGSRLLRSDTATVVSLFCIQELIKL